MLWAILLVQIAQLLVLIALCGLVSQKPQPPAPVTPIRKRRQTIRPTASWSSEHDAAVAEFVAQTGYGVMLVGNEAVAMPGGGRC